MSGLNLFQSIILKVEIWVLKKNHMEFNFVKITVEEICRDIWEVTVKVQVVTPLDAVGLCSTSNGD